jgi:hypothetical protein
MAASFARARAAADRAVSLDPEIAEAYLARSNVTFWYGLDLAATGPDVDRALALSPGSAWANFARGAVLLAAGLPREALGVLRKAVDLDPLDVGVWSWTLTALGAMGDVAGAREASDRQRQVAPDAAWNVSGLFLLLEGKTDAALAAFEREPDEVVRLWGLALARHRLGHPAAAREALDAFERRYGATQAVAIAEIHAQWGEIDAAFEWLERAYLRRNRDLILAKVNPFLGPLRGDPRFRALLAKMNVPDG